MFHENISADILRRNGKEFEFIVFGRHHNTQDKENRWVEIVVESQLPDAAPDNRKSRRRHDGKQSHRKTCQYAVEKTDRWQKS